MNVPTNHEIQPKRNSASLTPPALKTYQYTPFHIKVGLYPKPYVNLPSSASTKTFQTFFVGEKSVFPFLLTLVDFFYFCPVHEVDQMFNLWMMKLYAIKILYVDFQHFQHVYEDLW